jgi:hypothetical protein
MNLGQLRTYIEALPEGTVLKYSLSEPFSWRGSYAEVAFRIEEEESTREDLLKKIDLAFSKTFYGYKGGEYEYGKYTDVHFEEDYRSWTDGGYTANWISKLTEEEPVYSQEHRLVTLAFRPD